MLQDLKQYIELYRRHCMYGKLIKNAEQQVVYFAVIKRCTHYYELVQNIRRQALYH